MIEAVLEALRCPVCQGGLSSASGALRCAAGHSFDLAKQGYANLLTGRGPASADTPAMVAARAELLAAGHLGPVTTAVVRAARAAAGAHGLVVDVGAGTGHHLAAVLDALPDHHGVALDVSKAAARLAARAHPRIGAVVADVWRGLPLGEGCADLVLDLFAPRNGAEFCRVLRLGGTLLVVTPAADHLAELVGPLELVRVDPDKSERLDRSLGQWFEPVAALRHAYPLALSRIDTTRFVAMGPSAWHTNPTAVAARLARWTEPISVTVSVELRTYRRLSLA
jgi:23S rRNA (guanine745-N1)-methyltransferase